MWKREENVSSGELVPGRNGSLSLSSGHSPKSARCLQPA
jgi:hypothetical protein